MKFAASAACHSNPRIKSALGPSPEGGGTQCGAREESGANAANFPSPEISRPFAPLGSYLCDLEDVGRAHRE